MKKLLHIQLLPLMSGVQRFSLHLLDGLDADEYEIYVAAKPGGELQQEVIKRGFSFIPLPSFCHPISPLDFVTFLHLLWLIKSHGFDIVHTNSSKPGLLGRLAARLAGVPLILHTAHGTAFQDNQAPLLYRFYAFMELVGNKLGHKTVFVNNSDREKCLSMHLLPTSKAVTVYNAIPPVLGAKLTEIGNSRKMPEEEVIIGSTLRFSEQKNVIRLISCACKACMQAPNLRFVIMGDGEHFELCKAMVHSCNMDSRILLPGWDSDVIPWLKVFNAFVLYSRWEAQPFSIIEAMSAALPVIGSDIPSIRELVDEQSGYIVPLDDDEALVETFTNMAQDFKPAYAKGMAGQQRVSTLCSYQGMVAAYLELYRS